MNIINAEKTPQYVSKYPAIPFEVTPSVAPSVIPESAKQRTQDKEKLKTEVIEDYTDFEEVDDRNDIEIYIDLVLIQGVTATSELIIAIFRTTFMTVVHIISGCLSVVFFIVVPDRINSVTDDIEYADYKPRQKTKKKKTKGNTYINNVEGDVIINNY